MGRGRSGALSRSAIIDVPSPSEPIESLLINPHLRRRTALRRLIRDRDRDHGSQAQAQPHQPHCAVSVSDRYTSATLPHSPSSPGLHRSYCCYSSLHSGKYRALNRRLMELCITVHLQRGYGQVEIWRSWGPKGQPTL